MEYVIQLSDGKFISRVDSARGEYHHTSNIESALTFTSIDSAVTWAEDYATILKGRALNIARVNPRTVTALATVLF